MLWEKVAILVLVEDLMQSSKGHLSWGKDPVAILVLVEDLMQSDKKKVDVGIYLGVAILVLVEDLMQYY